MENKDSFNYTYSSKEQDEIKAIRKKYVVQEQPQDKMTLLRELDEGVTQKATIVSLVLGTIGALIMGTGMSLAMTDIGITIGFTETLSLVIGILTGILGIVLVSAGYPIYNKVIKKEREKIAPEILRLTDELMK